MKWKSFWQRHGYAPVENEGVLPDPFAALAAQAKQQGEPTVAINGRLDNGIDYGQTKCGFSATIHCPQDEKSMDMAAELVFRKTHEWVTAASQQLEIPPPVPFEEPK
jgi:hypothetical protein